MALAVEFDAIVERPPPQSAFQKQAWKLRESRPQPGARGNQVIVQQGPDAHPTHANTFQASDFAGIPVIKLTAAEKAERTRKGLCWYYLKKWIPGLVCKKTFLAYMGADEDDKEVMEEEQPSEELVTANLSHIYAMKGKPRTGSMVLQGQIGTEPVQVMVDIGSSHDFLHPRVAEKLKLSLTAVCPFRVYVGNGAFLVCSFASMATKLQIQQETFSITLNILPIHGPDVVLGLEWLHSLQRVTTDFRGRHDQIPARWSTGLSQSGSNGVEGGVTPISIAVLVADAHVFELVQLPPVSDVAAEEAMFPTDLPSYGRRFRGKSFGFQGSNRDAPTTRILSQDSPVA